MNEEETTLQATMEQDVSSGEPLATEAESATDKTALPVHDTVTNQKEASVSLEKGGHKDIEGAGNLSQEAIEDSSLPHKL